VKLDGNVEHVEPLRVKDGRVSVRCAGRCAGRRVGRWRVDWLGE